MVRTLADSARVASGSKAPKKAAAASSASSPPSYSEKSGSDNFPVNRYFPRETPAWQKEITHFFGKKNVPEKSLEPPQKKKILEEESNQINKRKSFDIEEPDMEVSNKQSFVERLKKFKSNNYDENENKETNGDPDNSMETE